MDRTISPADSLQGAIRLPGDKSISHRCAMLAAIAEGASEIENYSTGADCASTLRCLQALGVQANQDENRVLRVDGVGLAGLKASAEPLDAGNSGSTMRMLLGILAGQPFTTKIGGDESLSKRPMRRVIAPLEQMGAKIEAHEGEYPPLKIEGGGLSPIHHEPTVASAQVKTAVLFAGLFAEGPTSVREKLLTRNHTEFALRQFGADVAVSRLQTTVQGRPHLRGRRLRAPSDVSSAAFFIAGGLLLPGSDIRIEGVGLNPTRTALLDLLAEMGAAVEVQPDPHDEGEPAGTIVVRGRSSLGEPPFKGGEIEGAKTAALIDELPILAVLGAVSEEGLLIRDAAELRVKETDRIATVVENLTRMGIEVAEFDDGMNIPGRQRFEGAELDSFGDHRIAMAFTIAALAAQGGSTLENAEAADVSFPEFFSTLEALL